MTDLATEVRIYSERVALSSIEVDGRPGRFSEMQGRAIPYGQFTTIGGWYREQHAPQSFKRSTDHAANGLPLHMWHDWQSYPIGKSLDWEHTDDGLLGTWEIFGSAEAQRAASAAHDGELTGLSVGFMPERSKWDRVDPDQWAPELGPDHMDAVTHLMSRLIEVSLTSVPAYPDAGVSLVRTAIKRRTPGQPTEVEAWRRRIDSLRGT